MKLTERLGHLRELRGTGRGARHWVVMVLKVGVATALLAFAFRNVDVGEVKAQLANWASMRYSHLLLAGLALAAAQFVSAVRWLVLLRRWDVPLSLWQAFRLNMVGLFSNLALPTSVGGDALKMFFLTRHSGKGPESVTSVFIARLLGVSVLLLMGLTSGLLFAAEILPSWALGGAAALMVTAGATALFLLRSSWVGRWARRPSAGFTGKLRRAAMALNLLSHDWRAIGKVLILSFIIQLLAIHSYYEAAAALGVETSYLNFLVFMPLIIVVTMLPISIFGLGLRENAFIFLFGQVGITKAVSVSMSLTWTFVYLVVSLLGGLFLITLEDSFFVRNDAPAPASSEKTHLDPCVERPSE